MSTAAANQNDIFARSLEIRGDRLSQDVAQFFLELDLSPDDRLRLDELAAKSRAGQLSEADQRDLEEYRRVGRLVELMKLKARAALPRS